MSTYRNPTVKVGAYQLTALLGRAKADATAADVACMVLFLIQTELLRHADGPADATMELGELAELATAGIELVSDWPTEADAEREWQAALAQDRAERAAEVTS